MKRIEKRSGTAFRVAKGQYLTVIDPEGGQVSDLVCYSADDVGEVLSNGRTFDYEETIRLGKGNRLWSNRSHPMLTIVEDSCECHDFLLTPCSEATFEHFYPDKPVHRGCFGNLAEALQPYGIGEDAIPTAFNVFMNVETEGGTVAVKPPLSKAGDRIVLRAEMDLIVGLTACSAYASNGGSFKPIDYQVGADHDDR
ncbi:DUF1989 domain-containing protein [Pseudoblastomonas halimionae]|uniref:DUF1989 domain-containing protein n=1 Tax=Alteriqipengyuania halimionae TaxID=1926630 RepID=A0A6I4U1N3_9SPHN|nr:urea carboxylase-associated family protein [Alteriqipengyuania halimionae]MXP09204.1 DUF1989 domain-containing protein [Alteriqipengyuania halimionae]